ncbi:nucleotide sugar dehydrogenase [Rudanella lutea]|uniref:nucleotide sugar dehydrogenase n=1 Tax=Rudanella lutea TaxID=451374 RepID=UPI0003A2E62A|nr:nucleotide sugar dehydrogenase [Rudanella lutea]
MHLSPPPHIGIIGLGYVGLPLAAAFGRQYPVVGFDSNPARIAELRSGHDRTHSFTPDQLAEATHLTLTADPVQLQPCSVYIMTVPSPIDAHRQPDLTPILTATRTVGQLLKPGDVVVYESTVFPGCTEEECVPILEQLSGLRFNVDFFCGYSPERINPGDQQHTLQNIRKITSGSTPATARFVDQLYASIIPAGTYLAPSIRVAEAAKVIENCQRDINIAFINELALIFDRMGLDTQAVLEAARTKWNFLPFRPGLVGGHCIGVDPYYLTYKAESLGYHPQVILAGRRINDNMGAFVAGKVVKLLTRNGYAINGARALILGITFKENCADIRNSRVLDVIQELNEFGVLTDIYDPLADPDEVQAMYGLSLLPSLDGQGSYDAVVLTVAHDVFTESAFQDRVRALGKIVYDVKGCLRDGLADGRL